MPLHSAHFIPGFDGGVQWVVRPRLLESQVVTLHKWRKTWRFAGELVPASQEDTVDGMPRTVHEFRIQATKNPCLACTTKLR